MAIPAPTSPIRLAPSNISTSISGYCVSDTANASPPIPAPLQITLSPFPQKLSLGLEGLPDGYFELFGHCSNVE